MNVPLFLLFLLVSGNAGRLVFAQAPTGPVARLRSALERTFADSGLTGGQWGIEIVSLDRGETVFERSPGRLLVPASNQKILTAAAALLRLQPDFRFETTLESEGILADGTLKGNLVVRGTGDPTFSAPFHDGDTFRVFKEWAARLKEAGVKTIEGALVGDDSAFQSAIWGKGWEWDDLAYGYAAVASALQFNENLATLEITPGGRVGSPASVKCSPLEDYFRLDFRVATVGMGSERPVTVVRGEEKESLVVRGAVPRGGRPIHQTVSVQFPTEYFLYAFRKVMETEGLEVSRCSIGPARDYNAGEPRKLLWRHFSPPLADILKEVLKNSNNLFAETLVRAMGLSIRQEGSFEKGKEVVEEALEEMGIERGNYDYADGSGLSRQNLVSADTMVRALRHLHDQPYFNVFYDALAIAGVDGTISGRLKGKRAANNVHAKTGSLAHVSSLSGYVKTADGELLAFSMIANNFLMSVRAVESIQDSALEILADFSRK